jgi:hypothetical protein
MANKFLLVPEDIYRGLTTHDTGNINLDFIRHALDKTKRERGNASSKNIHYQQELRRYLHLRKEQEQKPVNVAVTGGDPFAGALIGQVPPQPTNPLAPQSPPPPSAPPPPPPPPPTTQPPAGDGGGDDIDMQGGEPERRQASPQQEAEYDFRDQRPFRLDF